MFPRGRIVSRPYGSVFLRSGKERSAEHKRSFILFRVTHYQPFGGGTLKQHSINIVPFTMLHTLQIQQILLHRNLGSVEHTRFVHIVPNVQTRCRPFVRIERKLRRPPIPYPRVCEIQIARTPRPAPSVEIFGAGFVSYVEPLLGRLLMDVVMIVAFHVRIDNGDHFPSLVGEGVLHGDWIGEETLVPGEVSFSVGVFDIEPQDIVGIIQFLEFSVNLQHIPFILIIPTTLVIPQRKHGHHLQFPGERRVLLVHLRHTRSREEKQIEDATLRDPVGCRAGGFFVVVVVREYIDKGFAGIEIENPSGPRFGM
mmetsp:Transcript_52531/g.63316  ORF Transcript_52531/g.63316 Transcript_52531/m.63316 type:complete len:311 (-) Transcript_52531:1392-2324(-)